MCQPWNMSAHLNSRLRIDDFQISVPTAAPSARNFFYKLCSSFSIIFSQEFISVFYEIKQNSWVYQELRGMLKYYFVPHHFVKSYYKDDLNSLRSMQDWSVTWPIISLLLQIHPEGFRRSSSVVLEIILLHTDFVDFHQVNPPTFKLLVVDAN